MFLSSVWKRWTQAVCHNVSSKHRPCITYRFSSNAKVSYDTWEYRMFFAHALLLLAGKLSFFQLFSVVSPHAVWNSAGSHSLWKLSYCSPILYFMWAAHKAWLNNTVLFVILCYSWSKVCVRLWLWLNLTPSGLDSGQFADERRMNGGERRQNQSTER